MLDVNDITHLWKYGYVHSCSGVKWLACDGYTRWEATVVTPVQQAQLCFPMCFLCVFNDALSSLPFITGPCKHEESKENVLCCI